MSSQPPSPRAGAIAWMASNPVAANLLMVFILAGGLIFGRNLKQEIFPEFELDVVTIGVAYPGASPAEVEQGILLSVEEAVRGVDGVKKVVGMASENGGSVRVELLTSANPDKALADIKNQIDRITTFPEEAEKPTVALLSRRSRVISLVIAGDLERRTLHQLVERARADLLARGGVTQVEVEGLPPLEISIEVPEDALRAYGLTLDEIARAIAASSLELPGGGVDTTSGEVLVRVADRALTAEAFANIPLRGTAAGSQVLLGDIATITDGFEETDQHTTFNGRPAALLTAYRVGAETPSSVASAVRTYAASLRPSLPPAVDVTIWDDDSELLRDRIDLLVRNGRTGLILVFLVLALFLNLRLAFWVGLGIPISFAGAFLLFPGLDISINMISLFALIITLGLVVDDAIVVGENIHEKTERGLAPLEAAITGAREMAVPVTFAILTTMAAFSPLLFVPGISGKIFGIIPMIVIAVLLFSLVEGFFILPAHLSHAATPPPWIQRIVRVVETPRRYTTAALAWFIHDPYQRLLHLTLRWRYAAVGLGVAILIVSLGLRLAGLVPFSFLPQTEGDIVKANARLPYGAPVEQTKQVASQLEAALGRAMDDLSAHGASLGVLVLVGQGPKAAMGPGAGTRVTGGHLVSVEADFVSSERRSFRTSDLGRMWETYTPPLPGVESLNFVTNVGPAAGAAVDVQLSHTDTEVLALASEEVSEVLRGFGDLTNLNNSYAAGKPQLDFQLTDAGRTLGLTSLEIGRQLRGSFFGAEALREQRGRNEVRVMVRLPKEERRSLYDLDRLQVRTPAGGFTPLSDVAAVTRTRAATTIEREDGRRITNVSADLAPGARSPERVLAELQDRHLPELLQRHPGLTARFAGEQEAQNEALDSLFQNFLLALLAIYALLAIPFRSYVQPAIIMSAIPFGFVGALWGHLAMGFELSVISLMGVVALSGVVVNDSLVLIDAANRLRVQENQTIPEAIIGAGMRRFRPILLTSLTTFFGLMPMIFEPSVQARFLIPMAISLGFGVLFATVIILLLVPALYVIVEDIKTTAAWLFVDPEAFARRAPLPDPPPRRRGSGGGVEGPSV